MPKTSSHNTVLLQTCFKTSYISVNAVLQPLHSQDMEEGLSDSCALPSHISILDESCSFKLFSATGTYSFFYFPATVP